MNWQGMALVNWKQYKITMDKPNLKPLKEILFNKNEM